MKLYSLTYLSCSLKLALLGLQNNIVWSQRIRAIFLTIHVSFLFKIICIEMVNFEFTWHWFGTFRSLRCQFQKEVTGFANDLPFTFFAEYWILLLLELKRFISIENQLIRTLLLILGNHTTTPIVLYHHFLDGFWLHRIVKSMEGRLSD